MQVLRLYHNLLEQFLHIAKANFAILFSSENIKTEKVRNSFWWNFPKQISEPREGLILAGNCHKSNYQDFSLIVLFGIGLWRPWGNTMIKLRKKYKELNLLVKKKQSITPWQYMHIFNSKEVTTVAKKTPENIIFYTHTILLLVIYSTDKETL